MFSMALRVISGGEGFGEAGSQIPPDIGGAAVGTAGSYSDEKEEGCSGYGSRKSGRQLQFQKTHLSCVNTSKGSQARCIVGKVAWGRIRVGNYRKRKVCASAAGGPRTIEHCKRES